MFIPLDHLFHFAFFILYVRHGLSLDITRYRFYNLTGWVCDQDKSLMFWKSSHKPDSVMIPWSLVCNKCKDLRRQSHLPLNQVPPIIPAGATPGLTFILPLLCSQLFPWVSTAGHTPPSETLSSSAGFALRVVSEHTQWSSSSPSNHVWVPTAINPQSSLCCCWVPLRIFLRERTHYLSLIWGEKKQRRKESGIYITWKTSGLWFCYKVSIS